MIRLPFKCLKQYTNAPTGHSTHAATTNATNPNVGPSTRQWQGLRLVRHSKHKGTKGQHGGLADPAIWAVTVSIFSQLLPTIELLKQLVQHVFSTVDYYWVLFDGVRKCRNSRSGSEVLLTNLMSADENLSGKVEEYFTVGLIWFYKKARSDVELPRTCRRATARQRAGLSNELAGPTRQWRFLSKLACILQYMILCSILRADLRPTTMWQFASIPSLLSRWGIWEGLSMSGDSGRADR